MKYYSTNGRAPGVSFREALLLGLAPDGGLYLPESLPALSQDDLNKLRGLDYPAMATEILIKYIGDEVDEKDIERLCRDAYNFEVPVNRAKGKKYILRLDQGPTASFKDFAARMMSRLMQHFMKQDNRKLTILTATSGDTGSAVANAFYGLDNIKVVILFPKTEVSEIQRKQMTTLQKNITVVAVDGKFDDCQDMVKRAFRDPDLAHIPLSSANSINIGRLLPQSVYYIYAWSRATASAKEKVIFSVPSGNFGNLTAGILASRMGLPVEKFIISTNENDEVPTFLKTGIYVPVVPSRNCISSAMNVGHPSNFARMIALYGGIMNEKGLMLKQPDLQSMFNELFGVSVSDEETLQTIKEVYDKYGIILEPHGAVAWKGITEFLSKSKNNTDTTFIALETAHPAKFSEEIFKVLKMNPDLPYSLSSVISKEEKYSTIDNNYISLKQLLQSTTF
ncbi:MAG TPA: threonine synthase [Bacteroidales bacterium]|nr:threonine synthase [Bacteroidales bacterium]